MIFALLSLNGVMIYAAELHDEIPMIFQGQWASDINNCNIDHIYNLTINSRSVGYWESGGSAISVVTRNEDELAVIVDFAGEGDEWIGFVHFHISSDGSNLKDISDPYSKTQLVRHKCPAK